MQKPQKCIDIVKEEFCSGSSIVFCNNILSAQKLYDHFINQQIDQKISLLHGKMPKLQRQTILSHISKNNDSDSQVIITTDLLARGVDFKGLSRVILYDFPHTLAEYLHRVGRTARAGKEGSVYALVTSKDRPFYNKIKNLLSK